MQACEKFRDRVAGLLREADQIANLISKPYPAGKIATRYQFSHYYEDPQLINAGAGTPIRAYSGFLRPGEAVQLVSGPDSALNQVYSHPNHPYPGWPSVFGSSWNGLLTQYPLVMRFAGEYRPFTPLLPNIPFSVEAFAFHGAGAKGHPPRPGWGPSGGAAPSPSSTPPGSPGPTPTPAATVTPFAAPDCSCCSDGSCGASSFICARPAPAGCDNNPIGD